MNGTTPAGPASPDAGQGGPAPLPNNNPNKPTPPAGPPAPPPPPEPPRPSPPPPPPPSSPPPPPPPGGAGAPPPPPPGQEIDIRTMASDTKSLQSSGGLGVEPKTFNPSDLAQDPAFTPQVDAATGRAGSHKKVLAIGIAIVVVLALAAAAVYFFVLPLFSPEAPEVVVDETPPPPPPPPDEPAFVHESFFAESPAALQQIALTEPTTGQLTAALATVDPLPSGTVGEFSFTVGGDPMTAQAFIETALPEVDRSLFAEDFTTFVYYTGEGAWSGYVLALGEGVDAAVAENAVRAGIEGDAAVEELYITDPGAPAGEVFRDGSVGDVDTRYLPFTEEGASFNYGWSGRFLIVSTSFEGFGAALDLLLVTDSGG